MMDCHRYRRSPFQCGWHRSCRYAIELLRLALVTLLVVSLSGNAIGSPSLPNVGLRDRALSPAADIHGYDGYSSSMRGHAHLQRPAGPREHDGPINVHQVQEPDCGCVCLIYGCMSGGATVQTITALALPPTTSTQRFNAALFGPQCAPYGRDLIRPPDGSGSF